MFDVRVSCPKEAGLSRGAPVAGALIVATMSEWYGFVACTCYQQGRTTEPPYPREQLTVNEFGIVTLQSSATPDEDPDTLYEWRRGLREDDQKFGTACEHEHMRLIDEIFYWPGARAHTGRYDAVEQLLADDTYPRLRGVVYAPEGSEYPSGGTWVRPHQAGPALADLERLKAQLPADLAVGDADFLRTLETLLEASVRTRNPIVTHYSGIIDGAW